MAFSTGSNIDDSIIGGGLGYGGMGGSCGLIIIVLLILFVLFRNDGFGHHDGHYDGGHGYPGYGFGGGCGPCVTPSYVDESNWQMDYHICKELGVVDKDVIEQGCKTREVEHCEAEKTRALIEQEYIQGLRDKIAEQNSNIQTMKSEAFTERKFDQLAAAITATNTNINNMFCKTDAMIAQLECEIPKRQPVFAETVTCNTHHVDCDRDYGRGYNNYPKRGCCDGYGDGYGYAI